MTAKDKTDEDEIEIVAFPKMPTPDTPVSSRALLEVARWLERQTNWLADSIHDDDSEAPATRRTSALIDGLIDTANVLKVMAAHLDYLSHQRRPFDPSDVEPF